MTLPIADALDVLPRLAINDIVNTPMVYTVLPRKHRQRYDAGLIQAPDLHNLFFGKFGIQMILAPKTAPAMLAALIVIIVRACAQKQMSRVAARWIVALVEYAKSVRYITVGQCPRDTMGKMLFTTETNRSISTVISTFRPRPTIVGTALINTRPKLSRHTSAAGRQSATIATEAPFTPTLKERLGVERLTAKLAFGIGCKMGPHRKPILSDAMPPAVRSGAGVLRCAFIIRQAESGCNR